MRISFFLSLLFFLLFFISCAGMKSGRFIRVEKNDSLPSLAQEFGISERELSEANPGKKFSRGSWIFIPQKQGLIKSNRLNRRVAQVNEDVVNFERVSSIQEGTFLWPVPASRHVSSGFGKRRRGNHEGLDISAPIGSYILSIDEGKVIYSGNELTGYGNLIVLAHPNHYFSVYAHSLKNLVKEGDAVGRGDVIALVGMTGRATGPHLHFEIRKDSKAYDPLVFYGEKSPALTAK